MTDLEARKERKERIKYFKEHPEIVYQEYIVNRKSTYQLAKEWGLPKSTVYDLTKNANLIGIKLAEKITRCNEEKFDIDDPVFCYLAGLASADGYIDVPNHRLVLRMSENAKEVLEYLRDYFEVSNGVKEYISNGGFIPEVTMYDLTISSRKLLDVLAQLNIIGRKKDLGVRFPDMGMLNDECKEMYMRGLWDGDGTSSSNNLTTSILEESPKMIEAIKDFLINYLELEVNDITGKEYPAISISAKNGKIFYQWLYRHNLDCKMQYKYDNYINNLV